VKLISFISANSDEDLSRFELQSQCKDQQDFTKSYEKNCRMRARNRWHLFLILVQNPSLQKYRIQKWKRKYSSQKTLRSAMKAINMTSFFETEDFENVEIEDVANASIGFPLKRKKEDKRGFLLKN